MQSPARALLALSTDWEDESQLDPVYYQELIESPEPREFRAVPAAVHGIQVDLALGNGSFAEHAEAASEEPDAGAAAHLTGTASGRCLGRCESFVGACR
ncbi:hypothetical protein AB0D13_33430 [Streptomyces sp. NPDC048430]|uniref:DUF6924 domain-containing protein n=1 Tax=Streptomyces sp. NPDC048430 TaxID=3155388 RepID=UPI0034462679